jgi:group I intron endonuclease
METKFIKANSKLIPRYTCGIYAIKNNLNGRMYIGSSTNIRAHYEAHYRSLHNGKGINKKLQQDFDEIGCENFNFIIVEECADNISTIKYLESKYIHEYGYYNCCEVDGRKIYCYDR